MEKFMIAYHGGNQPSSKEEGMAQMEKWKQWVQSLGDQVINPGTPLPQSKIVSAQSVSEDSGSDNMKGFAIVQAESMDEAVKIAQSDPFLANGGHIRLSQMMEMP